MAVTREPVTGLAGAALTVQAAGALPLSTPADVEDECAVPPLTRSRCLGKRTAASHVAAHAESTDPTEQLRPPVPVARRHPSSPEGLPQEPATQNTGSAALETLSTDAAIRLLSPLPRTEAEAVLLGAVVELDAAAVPISASDPARCGSRPIAAWSGRPATFTTCRRRAGGPLSDHTRTRRHRKGWLARPEPHPAAALHRRPTPGGTAPGPPDSARSDRTESDGVSTRTAATERPDQPGRSETAAAPDAQPTVAPGNSRHSADRRSDTAEQQKLGQYERRSACGIPPLAPDRTAFPCPGTVRSYATDPTRLGRRRADHGYPPRSRAVPPFSGPTLGRRPYVITRFPGRSAP